MAQSTVLTTVNDATDPKQTLVHFSVKVSDDSGASDLTTDTDTSGSSSPAPVSVYTDSDRSSSHSESEHDGVPCEGERPRTTSTSTSESGYGEEEDGEVTAILKKKPRTRRLSKPQRAEGACVPETAICRPHRRIGFRFPRVDSLLEVPSDSLQPAKVSILGKNNCLDPMFRLGWVEWAHSRARLHWAQFTGKLDHAESIREQERKECVFQPFRTEFDFKLCKSRYNAKLRIVSDASDEGLSCTQNDSHRNSAQTSQGIRFTLQRSPSPVDLQSVTPDPGAHLTDVEDCIHNAPNFLFELKSPIEPLHQSSMNEVESFSESDHDVSGTRQAAERRKIVSQLEKEFVKIGLQLQQHLSESTVVIQRHTNNLDVDSDDERTRYRYYGLMATVQEQYGGAKLVKDLKQEHARLVEQQVGELEAIREAKARSKLEIPDKSTRLSQEAQAKLRMRGNLDELRREFRRSVMSKELADVRQKTNTKNVALDSIVNKTKEDIFSSPNKAYSKVKTLTAVRKHIETESTSV